MCGATSDLTAAEHRGSLALMRIHPGHGLRRVSGGRSQLLAGMAGALLVAIAACSDSLPVAPNRNPAAAQPLPAATRYIVELVSQGPPPARFVNAVQAAGGLILRAHQPTGIVLVAHFTATAANALRTQPDVQMIVPDVHMRFIDDPPRMTRFVPSAAPAKTRANGQQPRLTPLGVNNPRLAQLYPHQWNMTQIRADTAWQVTTQGQGINVYILDSGVDTLHQDLRGVIDLKHSTSFAFARTDTLELNPLPFGHDVVGHGTFVSSLVAGNSLGMAAVAPQATLTMVRVLDDSGSGSFSWLLNGVIYAADSGADVISMSIGGYFPRDTSFFLAFADFIQRTVDYASQRGAVVVAAAGNEAVNTNSAQSPFGDYSAKLEMPAGLHHVMSIGATGPINQQNFDQIAIDSNYGKAGVGVFAPGGNFQSGSVNQADLVIGACSSSIFVSGEGEGPSARARRTAMSLTPEPVLQRRSSPARRPWSRPRAVVSSRARHWRRAYSTRQPR